MSEAERGPARRDALARRSLHHFEDERGRELGQPPGKQGQGGQRVGELPDILSRKIDEQPFGDHERVARPRTERREERAPGGDGGEVQPTALETADGLGVGECCALGVDGLREVDFDPAQAWREVEAVRPGVQAGSKVEHEVYALRDEPFDDLIHHLRAHDHRPRVGARTLQLAHDLLAARSGEPAREWIFEEGVRAFGFERSVHRNPVGGLVDGNGLSHARLSFVAAARSTSQVSVPSAGATPWAGKRSTSRGPSTTLARTSAFSAPSTKNTTARAALSAGYVRVSRHGAVASCGT